MQPFEIIKVRLQTQSKEAPQYSGIVDCLTKIVKNEGPTALYKGICFTTQALLLRLLESASWVQQGLDCLKTSRSRSRSTKETALLRPFS